jgi:predicted enzyme related to lactoylglutathione lyase
MRNEGAYDTLDWMSNEVLFAGIPVADFDAALPWYEGVFGRRADIVVNPNEVMWQVATAGWVYVVRDARNAGHALVALAVPDLMATLAAMESRGIVSPVIETVGDSGRKAPVVDPEGNTLAFIQVEQPGV